MIELSPRRVAAAVLAFCALTLAAVARQASEPALRVLFLGDRGHHEPAARAQELVPVLRSRGIDVYYTDTLESLAPANLALYDALLVYANIDRAPAESSKAIVDFVAGGKGLVALHCASYCFLDSDEYVSLVGAQFQSHGAEVFRETFVAPQHALLRGLEPIESWDETYVHHRNASDRVVLSERRHANGAEPYTWTRTQGKGRVFYTAWGHDSRTWTNAGFQDLVERGIRWSIGDAALARPRPKSEFTHSPAKVPHYEPNGPGAALATMQDPLSPERSRAHVVVPPNFEVRLFASEPQIAKPLCIAFDERGRAWIAESIDYPNDLRRGRDRIVILEDRDSDGRCDEVVSFADGLSIPTSVVCTSLGAIVLCPPDVIELRDMNGDSRADERHVLFTGFGTGDTHATGSNLRYGLDGWIWGTVGYSGFRGKVGGVEHSFSDAIFRFSLDGSALEVMGSTSNNTWGLGFTEDGAVFASTANGNPSVHLAIGHRYYEAVQGASPGVLATIADSLRIHPITSAVRQVDFHGLFTAAAGHAFYTARAFPPEYWNRAAFVCEPTGHVVARFFVEPSGASYVSREGWNLAASDDEWTAPIAAEVGPDGCVWVLDWYNYIVQHNPTPPGFENGAGNAFVTPLRDKTHGRVLRIVPRGFQPSAMPKLSVADRAGLVAALSSDNMLWRLHAQRMLAQVGGDDVVPRLTELVASAGADGDVSSLAAIHATHALEQLGALWRPDVRAKLSAALRSESGGVRRNVLDVLPSDAHSTDEILDANLLADPDARTRLAALLALARMPSSAKAGRAIAKLALEDATLRDRILADGVLCSAAMHASGFLETVLASDLARQAAASAPSASQLLANVGFEELSRADRPKGWLVRHYGGEAEHRVVPRGRNGSAIEMRSSTGSDTSFHATAQLDPDATYRLSGWIKTENLDARRCYGACLNVHEIQGDANARTPSVSGTSDWTRVEVVFEAGGRSEVTINCLFGGWGWATGTAWFDDVKLELVGSPGLTGPMGRIVSRVTRHFARDAGPREALALVERLARANETLATSILAGLAEAPVVDRAAQLDAASLERFDAAARALGEGPRELLVILLVDRWRLGASFEGLTREVSARLREKLGDVEAPADARSSAARRMIALEDLAGTIEALLGALDLDTEADLATGIVDAASESSVAELGERLVAKWTQLSPAAQRAASRALRRRAAWTRAMLGGIERGELPPSVLDPAAWQELANHPERDIAELSIRVRRKGAPEPALDFDAIAQRVGRLAGDRANGLELFRKNCAVCHVLGGEGGPVGPALDGVGTRPASELLVAMLDPSRSVEANYQLWVARTFDERIFSGRLVAETRTTIELLDSQAAPHVLERADVESITPSPLSLMPSGFESLGDQGLADLLALLREPAKSK